MQIIFPFVLQISFLLARFISIKASSILAWKTSGIDQKQTLLLVWGGLRGGLSTAMALSLSDIAAKDLIVFITYVIVLFSILVHGLTVGKVAKNCSRKIVDYAVTVHCFTALIFFDGGFRQAFAITLIASPVLLLSALYVKVCLRIKLQQMK